MTLKTLTNKEDDMKANKKAGELLKNYLRWPLVMILLFVALTACEIIVSRRGTVVAAPFSILGVIFILVVYLSSRKSLQRAIVGFAMELDEKTKKLADGLDIPYALFGANGRVAWENAAFAQLTKEHKTKAITNIFNDIGPDTLSKIEEAAEYHKEYNGRYYMIHIVRIEVSGDELYAMYLYDETELLSIKKDIDDKRMVAGLIYLDNYDEALESIEEVRRSLMVALIDRKVNQYAAEIEGIVKKIEKDKYLLLFEQKHMQELMDNRFELLEDVKTINIGNEMSITLSIGIGLHGENYAQSYSYARVAIDMALARGGDQAVVKDEQSLKYFGGKSGSVEKTTRVKARVKAHALRELMENKDTMLIMGHKLPDIDCLGAAVGLWRAATTLNKNVHIILGEVNSTLRPLKERFNTGEYPEDMFITAAKALEMANEDTVVAVVDVNRPVLTEVPELLDISKNVVVLDHHRQSADAIEHAVLSYVEPYASSASEMVAELVQYISDSIKIKSAESDAMYAGIVIDTNNFTNQTGVRTFEAAAYLRRNGADVTRVRKLFRENIEDYKAKAQTIKNAEIYKNEYALSNCPAAGIESPTVIGAQAANELLDIIGIKASVVFTEYNGIIYVSARSIDEVNVQIMMEKLGGGGHRTIAGAQLTEVGIDDARARVKEIIDEMLEKGEM